MNRCRKLLETRFLHEARSNTSAAIDKSYRAWWKKKKKSIRDDSRIIIINMGEFIWIEEKKISSDRFDWKIINKIIREQN